MAGEVAREVGGVDHGQHRVEPGDVGEADAGGVAEVEGGGDGQRLGDAGRLDEQVVEAALGGEAAHLGQEVVAQGAADAAVGHLDQASRRGAAPRVLGAHALGVDVHLGHVVDDDGDAQALAVAERMVEERRLAGAEEAGQDGDGQAHSRRHQLGTPVRRRI